MINTKLCKDQIVEWCKNNPQNIRHAFCQSLSKEELEESTNINNWKRTAKVKVNDGILREFNCVPFDDQLRAYVKTDKTDSVFISVTVLGE